MSRFVLIVALLALASTTAAPPFAVPDCSKPASQNPNWSPTIPLPVCPDGQHRNPACVAACLNTYHEAITALQTTYCNGKDTEDGALVTAIADCLTQENADPDGFDYYACALDANETHNLALAQLESTRINGVVAARAAYRGCVLGCDCE